MAPQPHDPQPRCRTGTGLHHVRHRLRPRLVAGREEDQQVKTLWLDVEGGKAYPVFDVHRGSGRDGRFTYPDDAARRVRRRAARATAGRPARRRAGRRRPGTCTPAGSTPTSSSRAAGARCNLFRSKAHYCEPAGAVSWDVAMTATPPDWRVERQARRRAQRVAPPTTPSARPGTSRWGSCPVAFAPGARGGVDPFSGKLDRARRAHARPPAREPQPRRRVARPRPTRASSPPARPPPARSRSPTSSTARATCCAAAPLAAADGRARRRALTFVNRDAAHTIFHTITACRAPCNRTTGIAYPLANGPVDFDSGELGFGPQGFTAAANRDTWSTPRDLDPGTYTYFCRIHPFMRGSFRVSGS